MSNFTIANKIELANPHANLDALYGPYQDLLEAISSVLPVLREKGLTVGVYENGTVVEYWWKSGTADADLIAKIGKDVMIERDYSGQSATKSVALAEEALYSEKADKDSFGRIIHNTYAIKDSGIEPPESLTIHFSYDDFSYTVTEDTPPALSVINNMTGDGEIILPTDLTADKALTIKIFLNEVYMNGIWYEADTTVFASFDLNNQTWLITTTLDPEIPDFSDMKVDVVLDNPNIVPKPGYIQISTVWVLYTLVFIKSADIKANIGIYQVTSASAGKSNLRLVASGTALHTVRVAGGDVWYSQYDGVNTTSLTFTVISGTAKKEIKLFRDNALLAVTSFSFMIDDDLNGWSVKSVSAYVPVASTSGTPTVTLTNLTTGNIITSTPVTIDANELTSLTAATPAVVNPAYKSVATGNLLSVNLTVTGTGAKGLGIIITFEK